MRDPIACVAAVTYRCNARCVICDIWKQQADASGELAPGDYAWLPRGLRSINVSGGEPFMRDDLAEIVEVMRKTAPQARIVISTNGLMPSRIESMVSRMGEVAVRISVDAVGEDHDKIRGIRGAYEKALETLRRLQALGLSDLGLAATCSVGNVGQMVEVKGVAEKHGVDFVTSVAHSSPFYFGPQDQGRPNPDEAARELKKIMREQLRSRSPRDWARAYYTRGLIDYVDGKSRRLRCGAGVDFFFLDPGGDVYPCNILDVKIGNMRDGSFEELRAGASEKLRKGIGECRNQCWMVCTVAPAMKRRPLGPMAWIAGAKLLGLDTARKR